MKKLVYLLSLLLFATGCSKPGSREYVPLVPYGTFNGKFMLTHTDPGTGSKNITSANIQLVMTTTGFTVTSDAATIHASGNGDFLGNELAIEFTDPNYPSAGTGGITYLHGNYAYTFDGNVFKLSRQSGDDSYLYDLAKKW